MSKKACIVFSAGLSAAAEQVAARLKGEGYEVCLAEASDEEAAMAEAADTDNLLRTYLAA